MNQLILLNVEKHKHSKANQNTLGYSSVGTVPPPLPPPLVASRSWSRFASGDDDGDGRYDDDDDDDDDDDEVDVGDASIKFIIRLLNCIGERFGSGGGGGRGCYGGNQK
ncbi:hypothetical protein BLOT_012650 [Blomia tropicalis]|nr:hypothetical protein BLOT_012650 [Blomia tropicalis]